MKRLDEIYWARWLLLPCALWALLVIIPCSMGFITRYFFQSSDYIFFHNAEFWNASLTGLVCGFAWVAIIGAVAPSHKFVIACLSCLPGGLLAWVLMGEAQYRVDPAMSFPGFETHVPLYLCGWAGAVGLFVLWRRRKRGYASAGQDRRPSRVVGVAALAMAAIVFCAVVVPSIIVTWRFALYHLASDAVSNDGEEKALLTVRRLVKLPLFELDWTPGRILALIPFGYDMDMEIFGCPSCRGIHTPLFHKAAAKGYALLLRQMLDWRASPDYWGDNGQEVLSAAIRSHDTNTVALLLSRGVKASGANTLCGGAMVQSVIYRAPVDLMAMLIDAGASVNATNRVGKTPLDCANIWDPDAIPFLLAQGASNAVVRVHLIPVPGSVSQFRFEGTQFGIRLPPGISSVNRCETPKDCSAWQLQTVDRGSLSFFIGRVTKGEGSLTNFNGFAAVAVHHEYDWGDGKWSAGGGIAFDSSGYTHEELQRLGRMPQYNAIVEYRALKRRDLKRIQEAMNSLGWIAEMGQRASERDGVTASQVP